MINLRIVMNDGQVFNITNQICNNVNEWARKAFVPHGVHLKWYEIVKGTIIQVSNISYVRILTDKDITALNNPELPKPNTDAQNDTGSEDNSIEKIVVDEVKIETPEE